MTSDGQTGEAMVWDLEQLMSDSLHERGVAASPPPLRASVKDPVFPHLIAWLTSEFGLEDIPLLAAQYPCSDHLNPHRGQLAVLASENVGDAAQRVPGTEWNRQVKKAAADYMQFAGYQACESPNYLALFRQIFGTSEPRQRASCGCYSLRPHA